MKKIYTAFLLVFACTLGNSQKVYFKQTFDKPTFGGTTTFLTSGDYFGPPTASIYNQVASSSNYSSPTPDSSQFTFIGTGAAGVDSIVPDGNGGYAIELEKTSGSSNSCTLERSISVSKDGVPTFLVINFDITPGDFSASKVANSFYCTTGALQDTLRSESTSTGLATRLAISPNGGATNIFRLRDPGTPVAMGVDSFTTGSKYTVAFIVNGASDSTLYHTYYSPSGTLDSVKGMHWDAWITTSGGVTKKQLSSRVMANPANPLQGFRFLVTNGPQVSYIIDNVVITDGQISTLPINLANFDAAKINTTKAAITWTVANANNVKQFEVTKSLDGSTFKSIGVVSFSGIKAYSFVDNNLTLGTSFYRLSSIDKNGLTHYSNVVTVSNKASGISGLYLAPNIISNTTTLNINASKQDFLTVKVFDINGRTVLQKGISLSEGSNKANIDLSNLKTGSYFLKTISSDGSIQITRFEKL